MPQGKHLANYRQPRKGEKRRVVQPTAIEKLPGELRDKVRAFVNDARDGNCICGKQQPHRHSWDGLAEAANKQFALKLSATQYHRDFDVFVEQAQQESEERAQHVMAMTAMFARIGIKDLPQATLNALAGESYAALKSSSGEERRAALANLLLVQAKLISAQAAQQRVDLEKDKLEARRAMAASVAPREVYLAAVEELVKKLLTRKEVRAVLQPIARELVEELSKSAESFAKRIEAQQAG